MCVSYAQDGGAWEPFTNFPSANGLYGQTANVVNGKAYLAFGIDKNAVVSTDIYEFNPIGAVWTKKQSFPGTPRYGCVSFAIGDTIYYVDGCSGSAAGNVYDFWAYSIQGNTWTEKINRLQLGRTCATAFSINGKGYIYGGTTDSTDYLNDLWEFNPAYNTWSSYANIPLLYGRIGASSFVINGKAYICGGQTEGGIYLHDTWEFEPIKWEWVQKASRPAGSETVYGTAFSLDRANTTKGYYGLGSRTLQSTNDFPVSIYEYDLHTDAWELINDFPGSGRSNSISFVIANTAYVGAGASDTKLPAFEKDIWTLSMPGNGTFIPSISGRVHQDLLFLQKGKIIAYNLTTKRKYSVLTNAMGEFLFNSLPQGKYILKAIANPEDKFDNTFYPNKVDSLKSVMLTLGSTISEIDLFMHATKTDTRPDESTFGSFDIYPNPFEKLINIISLHKDAVLRSIQVSDIMGNIQQEIVFDYMVNSYELHMENSKPGIYILKIESSAGLYIKKITK